MFFERVMVSIFHFLLMVVASGFVITLTYRVFLKANPDFDMEEEIRKGNVATGVLVATILVSASHILMAGTESSVEMFRLHMLAPGEGSTLTTVAVLIVAHMAVSLLLALISISSTLRLFGLLTRRKLHAGQELKRGNLAVGLILSSVVLVTSFYVREGVSALSKALSPQPSIGRIRVMR